MEETPFLHANGNRNPRGSLRQRQRAGKLEGSVLVDSFDRCCHRPKLLPPTPSCKRCSGAQAATRNRRSIPGARAGVRPRAPAFQLSSLRASARPAKTSAREQMQMRKLKGIRGGVSLSNCFFEFSALFSPRCACCACWLIVRRGAAGRISDFGFRICSWVCSRC